MTEPENVVTMWQAYLRSIGEDPSTRDKTYTAWHFCDNEADANALAELVKTGQKRATASSLPVYEQEKQAIPKVGDLSVILDWAGRAQCVIQTTRVEITPFCDVSAEFAWMEGEGDRSLAYWRRGHQHFFSRELEALGLAFDERMPVVCEHFEVVFGVNR